MTKAELLAPAGGPDAFAAALAGGADAVYCGIGDAFNARRRAENFSLETFAAACKAAHASGVRVYVTLNVAIEDAELEQALELVACASAAGADAFIVQDWGLFAEIRERMPHVELHVSTQAAVMDARGARFCREMGADRVTLARELSLGEIDRIAREGVEVEAFCHGSICFCYSGLCLLSGFAVTGRSANRGLCAQPCRLPYRLVDADGRALSAPGRERALCPRDACTEDMVPDLLQAGVYAFKLEGRMKAPDYVLGVTAAYRSALDEAIGQPAGTPRPRGAAGADGATAPATLPALDARARKQLLARCFNRDFTHAYLDGTSGDEMMSYGRSNNRGQVVGRVVASISGEARIMLSEPVGAGDLVEMRPADAPDKFLTARVPRDMPARCAMSVPVRRPMPAGTPVRAIRTQRLVDAAEAAAQAFREKLRAPAEALAPAPVGAGGRDADTPAGAPPRGETRSFRRDRTSHTAAAAQPAPSAGGRRDAALCALVNTAQSAEAARRAGAGRVYVDVSTCEDEELLARLAEAVAHGDGKQAAGDSRHGSDCRLVPWLDEVCREKDRARLDPWVRAGGAVAVGNVSELALAREVGAAAEVRECIPVHNAACVRALENAGAAGFWLSPELSAEGVRRVARAATVPVGIALHGTPRVMTSEHCVLRVQGPCSGACETCARRRQTALLETVDDTLLPVRTDRQGRSRIYSAAPVDLAPYVGDLLEAGVARLLVDGTLLEPEEVARALERARDAVDRARSGRSPLKPEPGSSTGLFLHGVQ